MTKATTGGGVAYLQGPPMEDSTGEKVSKFGPPVETLHCIFGTHTDIGSSTRTKRSQKSHVKRASITIGSFHPVEPWICSADDQGTIVVWNYQSKRKIHSINLDYVSLGNNNHVVQSTDGIEAHQSQKLRRSFHASSVSSFVENKPNDLNHTKRQSVASGDLASFEALALDEGGAQLPTGTNEDIDWGPVIAVFFMDPDVVQATTGVSSVNITSPWSDRCNLVICCQQGLVLYDMQKRTTKAFDCLNEDASAPEHPAGGESIKITSGCLLSCAHILLGCSDGSIRIWDVLRGRACLSLRSAHQAPVSALHSIWGESIASLSSNSGHALRFASGCTQGSLLLWELHPAVPMHNALVGVGSLCLPSSVSAPTTGRHLWRGVSGYTTGISKVSYDASTHQLIATTTDRHVAVWSLGPDAYVPVSHFSTFSTVLHRLRNHHLPAPPPHVPVVDNPFAAEPAPQESPGRSSRAFRSPMKPAALPSPPAFTRRRSAPEAAGFRRIPAEGSPPHGWSHASTSGRVAARLVFHVANAPRSFTGDCLAAPEGAGGAKGSFLFVTQDGEVVNAMPLSLAAAMAERSWAASAGEPRKSAHEQPAGVAGGHWNEQLASAGRWTESPECLSEQSWVVHGNSGTKRTKEEPVQVSGMVAHPARPGRLALLTNHGVFVLEAAAGALPPLGRVGGSSANRRFLCYSDGHLQVVRPSAPAEDARGRCTDAKSIMKPVCPLNPWMCKTAAAPLELNKFRDTSEESTNSNLEILPTPITLWPGQVELKVLQTRKGDYLVCAFWKRIQRYLVVQLQTVQDPASFDEVFSAVVVKGGDATCVEWVRKPDMYSSLEGDKAAELMVGCSSRTGEAVAEQMSALQLPSTIHAVQGMGSKMQQKVQGARQHVSATFKRNTNTEVSDDSAPNTSSGNSATDGSITTEVRVPEKQTMGGSLTKKKSFTFKKGLSTVSQKKKPNPREELVASLMGLHSRPPQLKVITFTYQDIEGEEDLHYDTKVVFCACDPLGIVASGPLLLVHFGNPPQEQIWRNFLSQVSDSMSTDEISVSDVVGAGMNCANKSHFYSWTFSDGQFGLELKPFGDCIESPQLTSWHVPKLKKNSLLQSRMMCALVYHSRSSSLLPRLTCDLEQAAQRPQVHILVCDLYENAHTVQKGKLPAKCALRYEGAYAVGDCDDYVIDLFWFHEALFVLSKSSLTVLPFGRNVQADVIATLDTEKRNPTHASSRATLFAHSSADASAVSAASLESKAAELAKQWNAQQLLDRKLEDIDPVILMSNRWRDVRHSLRTDPNGQLSHRNQSTRAPTSSACDEDSWAFACNEPNTSFQSSASTSTAICHNSLRKRPIGNWRIAGISNGNMVLFGRGATFYEAPEKEDVLSLRFIQISLEQPYLKFVIFLASAAIRSATRSAQHCSAKIHDRLTMMLEARGYCQVAIAEGYRLEGLSISLEFDIIFKHLILDALVVGTILNRVMQNVDEVPVWLAEAARSVCIMLMIGASEKCRNHIPLQYRKQATSKSCVQKLEEFALWLVTVSLFKEAQQAAGFLVVLQSDIGPELLVKVLSEGRESMAHITATAFTKNSSEQVEHIASGGPSTTSSFLDEALTRLASDDQNGKSKLLELWSKFSNLSHTFPKTRSFASRRLQRKVNQ